MTLVLTPLSVTDALPFIDKHHSRVIGSMEDDPELLMHAAIYLIAWRIKMKTEGAAS